MMFDIRKLKQQKPIPEMQSYILFIDTETSGMPKHWNASLDKIEKWPYLLQVAWVVCSSTGDVLKSENHYINPGNINIDPEAYKIHGIDLSLLEEKGELRVDVMRLLQSDILSYQPLMVGHFLEFDCKMLSVGFKRAGLDNNLCDTPGFCTMLHNRHYKNGILNPGYMRLDELYLSLFNKPLQNQHNAIIDAMATRDCFFEMLRIGTVDTIAITKQQKRVKNKMKLT